MRRVSFPSPRVETRLHVCEAHRNETSISTSGGNTIHERGLPPGIVGLCVTTNQLRVGRVGSTPARAAIAHESKGLTPMAGAGAGRGTKHEKEFAIGRTLSTAPRGEFHDRVSGQQHAGTQATWGPPPPSLVRVSGIEHTGLVQGRTEESRAYTKRYDWLEPSTADRARALRFGWPSHGSAGGVGGSARGRVVGGSCASRSRVRAECHPIPVCQPRRFAAS